MADNTVKKARIEFLDYLRGIAILGVIILHSFPTVPSWRVDSSLTNVELSKSIVLANGFIYDLFNFAVPAFIFISGLVLAYNYPDSSFNPFKFIKNRLLTVVPGYILFSLIAIIGLGIFNGFPSITVIIYQLLTASASDPLWYIAVIIQLYIFYPLIIRIYNYFEKKRILIVLFAICLSFSLLWKQYTPFLISTFSDESHFVASRIFIPQLIFFIAGMYASRNYQKIIDSVKKYAIALMVILAAGIAALFQVKFAFPGDRVITGLLYIIFCYMTILLAAILARKLSEHKHIVSRSIRSFGTYSFGIYMIHPVVVYAIAYSFFLVNLSVHNWLVYPLLFVLTVVFSYLFTYIVSYLPYSRYYIGVHNQLRPARGTSSASQ